MTWLGQHLAAQGHTVYIPRQAGHGTDVQHQQRARWEDWYLTALDGVHVLRAQCDRVFVAGLSMGGLVTLLLGATVPLDGLIVLAAPLHLPQVEGMLRAARFIKWVRPFVYAGDVGDFPNRLREEQGRRGEPIRGRVRYETWATQAVEELAELMHIVASRLPDITAPALVIYSEGDKTVPVHNQQLVVRGLGSHHIEAHTLHDSDHILTQDRDREQVFALAAAFIDQLTNPHTPQR